MAARQIADWLDEDVLDDLLDCFVAYIIPEYRDDYAETRAEILRRMAAE